MKLNEKEKQRVNALIEKALDKSKGSLTEEEVKELKRILLKLNDIEKKRKEEASKTALSEVIETSMTVALARKALKESEYKEFNKLPVSEKMKSLKEKVEKLQNGTYAQLLKKEKEVSEKEAFEAYYEEHAKQFGKSL